MKARLIAAGLHFLGSALIIFLFLSVVYFIWYPRPFYIIHSVFDAVKIVLVVDLVLGPFLTFVIFNVVKPRSELIRDVSIIILIQIAALIWGMHITYKMRPVFFVFQNDTFYSVIKEDVNLENLSETVSPPTIWQQPKSIYIEPLSSQQIIQRMDDIIRGGEIKGEMYQANKYRPLAMQLDGDYMQDVVQQAFVYSELLNSEAWKSKVEQFLQFQSGAIEDYLFYPVENARQYNGIVIFNKKDFSFAGLID